MIEDKKGPAKAGSTEIAANETDGDTDSEIAEELPDERVPVSPEERLAAIETELADSKDRLLRALAETENVRRRLQRERDDAQKYAVGGFARDLLSVVDNLRRALDAMPESAVKDARTRRLREGGAATERELPAVLQRHRLQRIGPQGR